MTELGELGLVEKTSAQVRVHPAAPMFKLYLINNNDDAFFGFYPIVEHVINFGGETAPTADTPSST